MRLHNTGIFLLPTFQPLKVKLVSVGQAIIADENLILSTLTNTFHSKLRMEEGETNKGTRKLRKYTRHFFTDEARARIRTSEFRVMAKLYTTIQFRHRKPKSFSFP